MPATAIGSLMPGLEALPGILAFRLLPFVAFVAFSRRYSPIARALSVALYVPIVVVAARHGATPFHWLILAYLYFAAAGCVAHGLLPYVPSNAAWFAVV